jgi:hypothetical protein
MPAGRRDLKLSTAGGAAERRIEVFNKGQAWMETEPGLSPKPATLGAADRALQALYLTPHGAIRAAVDAPAKDVQYSKVAGKDVIKVTKDGFVITATLNADSRPELITVTGRGLPPAEAALTEYKDWDGYDIYFPAHLVERVNGKVVLDLKVTEFRSNAYVVFPPPRGELAK